VVDLIVRHGLARKQFRFFDSEEQFMQLAARAPRSNCVLDCGKALHSGLKLSDVHEALEMAMRRWQCDQ
jgi:UDP-glucose 4,6-dehydratase